MRINAEGPIALAAVLLLCTCLTACDGGSRRDYNYYKNHPDEAQAFASQCTLNGTMGMVADQIEQCNAARNAYAASKQR